MGFKDLLRWNTRVSGLYAFGVWTMIGSYAYFRYTSRYEQLPTKEQPPQGPEDPNTEIFQTAHTKTIITYKKDFVPYTTQVYSFLKSFSNEPRTGDADK